MTMRQAILWRLYLNWQKEPEHYIPVHEFMGEIFCGQVNKWGYVSYECSARCSEMNKENPELIQRETLTGKSGAHYYGYRLHPAFSPSMIIDEDLREFFNRIRP